MKTVSSRQVVFRAVYCAPMFGVWDQPRPPAGSSTAERSLKQGECHQGPRDRATDEMIERPARAYVFM